MKKTLNSVIFYFLLSTSLFAQKVISIEKSASADFSSYQSFRFAKINVESMEVLNAIREGVDKTKAAITNELLQRGIREDLNNPNLLVNLGFTVSEEVQTRETTLRDAPVYMGTRNYKWESEEVVVDTYLAGTIVIEAIDLTREEVVWRGVVQSVIVSDSDKNSKMINRGMSPVFKKFPVKRQ